MNNIYEVVFEDGEMVLAIYEGPNWRACSRFDLTPSNHEEAKARLDEWSDRTSNGFNYQRAAKKLALLMIPCELPI